jgi:hypothetical protein
MSFHGQDSEPLIIIMRDTNNVKETLINLTELLNLKRLPERREYRQGEGEYLLQQEG